MSSAQLILLGAGGHAKVLLDLLQVSGKTIVGVCDPQLAASGRSHWRGLPVLGDDQAVERYQPEHIELVNGIGGEGHQGIFERFGALNYRFASAVHPSVIVASGLTAGQGVQLMAGVIVQSDVSIGANSIVNTGAQLDHDTQLGAHVHVAPGAVLAGDVSLGDGVFIGPGAILGRGVQVGEGAVIGAGTVVLHSVAAHSRVLGRSLS